MPRQIRLSRLEKIHHQLFPERQSVQNQRYRRLKTDRRIMRFGM